MTAAEGGVCSEETRGTCAEPRGGTEMCVTLGGIERRAFIFYFLNFLFCIGV